MKKMMLIKFQQNDSLFEFVCGLIIALMNEARDANAEEHYREVAAERSRVGRSWLQNERSLGE